jgi:uncharacterized protein (TIGR02271 family)
MSDEPETVRENLVIPVVDEELQAGAKAVKTGSVRVDKHVDTRIQTVDMPLLHEDVEVKRVPVNRPVKEMPSVRKTGDTIIVPVVEEELVITKRLVLKEEIHLVRRRTKGRFVKNVEVDRERADVKRLDANGQMIDARARAPRKRGLLE